MEIAVNTNYFQRETALAWNFRSKLSTQLAKTKKQSMYIFNAFDYWFDMISYSGQLRVQTVAI